MVALGGCRGTASRWAASTGMVDPLLDARARSEHAARSFFLDSRATSLVRFETTIGEPGDGGVAAALAAFKQGWHDVQQPRRRCRT